MGGFHRLITTPPKALRSTCSRRSPDRTSRSSRSRWIIFFTRLGGDVFPFIASFSLLRPRIRGTKGQLGVPPVNDGCLSGARRWPLVGAGLVQPNRFGGR